MAGCFYLCLPEGFGNPQGDPDSVIIQHPAKTCWALLTTDTRYQACLRPQTWPQKARESCCSALCCYYLLFTTCDEQGNAYWWIQSRISLFVCVCVTDFTDWLEKIFHCNLSALTIIFLTFILYTLCIKMRYIDQICFTYLFAYLLTYLHTLYCTYTVFSDKSTLC